MICYLCYIEIHIILKIANKLKLNLYKKFDKFFNGSILNVIFMLDITCF